MADIGDRIVMRSNHWCRPNHKGVVVPLPEGTALPETTKAGRVLVKFDHKGVGIGGEFLFVDEEDFKVVPLSTVQQGRLAELQRNRGKECRIPKA